MHDESLQQRAGSTKPERTAGHNAKRAMLIVVKKTTDLRTMHTSQSTTETKRGRASGAAMDDACSTFVTRSSSACWCSVRPS
jgi:hypothetical protein